MQKIIISSAFFAVVYIIYGFVRPEWCNFHEQYQMFLFGWDYLSDHLSIPSGTADYLAEFVVQFFFFPGLGAAFWAAMLTGLGLLVWRASLALRPGSCGGVHLGLAFVPPVVMACYSGDYNMMLAFPMSMLLALAFFLLYTILGDRRRVYAQALIIPIVYWIAGYGVFVYAVLCAVADARRFWGKYLPGLMLASAYLAWAVLCVLMAGYTICRQYPFIDLYCGINFYRDRLVIPSMQHIVAVSFVLMPAVLARIPACGKFLTSAEAVLAVSAIPLLMPLSYDKVVYTLLKIDYLVRLQRWNDVISLCQTYMPEDYMACNGLNLALAKTGQLPERMFEFTQMGQNGLVGNFERNAVSAVITGEIFYHLGLVNQVLRVYFDSQASIVNCNRSARFTHRIAEAYLLNGNYDMAAKHIRMLQKTLFYSRWADEAHGYLGHPEKVYGSRRWNQLLRHKLQDKVLYTVTDLNELLLRLYAKSPDNQLALQYSLACDLLNGDLQHFMKILPLSQPGKSQMKEYANVPRSYQEAVAYVLLSQGGDQKALPPFVSPGVRSDFQDFDRMMVSGMQPSGRLMSTYWYYLVSNR